MKGKGKGNKPYNPSKGMKKGLESGGVEYLGSSSKPFTGKAGAPALRKRPGKGRGR